MFSASEKKSYTPVIEELAPTEQVETQAKAFNLESEIPAPPRVQQQVQPSVQESRININNRNLEGKKVIIDPGHGGKDSGAVGNGLLEKDITLEFSKAIKQALNEHKINVKLTRNGDYENQFPTYLDEYKTDKDAFISIHANSVDNPSVCGVEIFAEDHTESYKLANTIYKHIKQDLGAEFSSHCSNWDRGVKAASTSRARFISRAGSPSVLVETAFISNANDAKIFKDPQLKTKLIKAIAEGTEEYLAKK